MRINWSSANFLNKGWHRKLLELFFYSQKQARLTLNPLRVIMMPTLLSLTVPDVVITTSGAARDDKVDMMITPGMMPAFLSLAAPEVVITTSGAASANKVGIVITFASRWEDLLISFILTNERNRTKWCALACVGRKAQLRLFYFS